MQGGESESESEDEGEIAMVNVNQKATERSQRKARDL